MKAPVYRCTYEDDDNGTVLVRCDSFPELVTFGDDIAWAAVNARGAIEEAIAARISDGREIPPGVSKTRFTGDRDFPVKLDQLTAQKVMLYNLLPKLGVTRAELARGLNWHREQVDRLFRLDHQSRATQMEAAFEALGYEIETSVKKKSTAQA